MHFMRLTTRVVSSCSLTIEAACWPYHYPPTDLGPGLEKLPFICIPREHKLLFSHRFSELPLLGEVTLDDRPIVYNNLIEFPSFVGRLLSGQLIAGFQY